MVDMYVCSDTVIFSKILNENITYNTIILLMYCSCMYVDEYYYNNSFHQLRSYSCNHSDLIITDSQRFTNNYKEYLLHLHSRIQVVQLCKLFAVNCFIYVVQKMYILILTDYVHVQCGVCFMVYLFKSQTLRGVIFYG